MQCVRKTSLQKPDHELRFYPMIKAFEQSKLVSKVLFFNSRQIPRQMC